MNSERLHALFDENPKSIELAWMGMCHDCGKPVEIVAELTEKGIEIRGGAVFEPDEKKFFMKCDECYEKKPELTDYQPCEVYSRVVGYLRPISQWNPGKLEEFEDRRMFDGSLRSKQ